MHSNVKMNLASFCKEILPFNQAYDEFHMDQAYRLGAGGFGKVYLLKARKDGKRWAAKYQKQPNEKYKRMVRLEALRIR